MASSDVFYLHRADESSPLECRVLPHSLTILSMRPGAAARHMHAVLGAMLFSKAPFFTISRANDEFSLITDSSVAPSLPDDAAVVLSRDYGAIQVVEGESALSAVGVISSITRGLSSAIEGLIYLSTFSTDLILVPRSQLWDAVGLLKAVQAGEPPPVCGWPGPSGAAEPADGPHAHLWPVAGCVQLIRVDRERGARCAVEALRALFYTPEAAFVSWTQCGDEVSMLLPRCATKIVRRLLGADVESGAGSAIGAVAAGEAGAASGGGDGESKGRGSSGDGKTVDCAWRLRKVGPLAHAAAAARRWPQRAAAPTVVVSVSHQQGRRSGTGRAAGVPVVLRSGSGQGAPGAPPRAHPPAQPLGLNEADLVRLLGLLPLPPHAPHLPNAPGANLLPRDLPGRLHSRSGATDGGCGPRLEGASRWGRGCGRTGTLRVRSGDGGGRRGQSQRPNNPNALGLI